MSIKFSFFRAQLFGGSVYWTKPFFLIDFSHVALINKKVVVLSGTGPFLIGILTHMGCLHAHAICVHKRKARRERVLKWCTGDDLMNEWMNGGPEWMMSLGK